MNEVLIKVQNEGIYKEEEGVSEKGHRLMALKFYPN